MEIDLKSKWKYTATKMPDCLSELSMNFKFPNELILEKRESEFKLLAEETAGLTTDSLWNYAALMSNRDVENLLFALVGGAPGEIATRFLRLLSLRMSERIVILIWAFYTYEYKNSNMDNLVSLAVDFITHTELEIPQGHMLRIVSGNDPLNSILLEIENNNSIINQFLSYYDISKESPLAIMIARKFLTTHGKEGFVLNEGWMRRLIKNRNADNSLIGYYLNILSVEEYITPINESILEHLGHPQTSASWGDCPEQIKQKLVQWCFLKEIRKYFERNLEKTNLLGATYLPYIKEIKTAGETDTHVFVVDFGEFAIIDTEAETEFSYLCDEDTLKTILEGIAPETGKAKLFEARNFIIEEADNDLLSLSFHDVGRLYIKDTLNILLGITPDSRSSKSIIAAKIKQKKNTVSL